MFNSSMFEGVRAGHVSGGGFEADESQLAALTKALTAGYGTDTSTLTGGGAFRIQSLDRTMMATIQDNQNFRLMNALRKIPAGTTVDEWTEQSSVGGFLGGSTNTETGNASAATGVYARRTALVKYLMTRREVSFVSTLGNNIVEAQAAEAMSGARQLLTDAEYLSFEGDSTVVPTEFDGIYAQMTSGVTAGLVDTGNVLDAQGQSLASINLVNQAAQQIAGVNGFGKPTHIFLSQQTQADFDTGLDPAFRVPLTAVGNGGLSLGAPVVGIRTSWGNIENAHDVFIRENTALQPFEVLPNLAATATANVAIKPQTVTLAVATDTASQFGASQAGNYYYLVTGVNAAGQSTGLVSAQQAVTAGQKVTLTITGSAGAGETGYVIYRSRLNGAGVVAGSVALQGSDFRYMARVARAGATTPYVDYNRDIPGTTKAYVLNLDPGYEAMSWKQLLPMMKFMLYPTASMTVPWIQAMFGYLRITKRRQHVVIKNILPNGSNWRPFN